MSARLNRQQLEAHFKRIDTNSSGFIERAEFEKELQQLDFTQKEIDGILRLIDTDKNGKISIEEFLSALQ